ncbi:GIY-YIG nuclease family protein [Lyngbya aestuarii]|uniref:GIY-YIG nuclease family protein n=1 Tax=Lyngbya aestuarii TaxID=118322 RepID=UPI00403DF257
MTDLPITLETIFSLPALPLEHRELLPECPGLYFVYSLNDDRQLLYIGKAENIREQWLNHNRLRDLQIVACVVSQVNLAWLEFYATPEILSQQEQILIKRFRPPINELTLPDDYAAPSEQQLIEGTIVFEDKKEAQPSPSPVDSTDRPRAEVLFDVVPESVGQLQKQPNFWAWVAILIFVVFFIWESFS